MVLLLYASEGGTARDLAYRVAQLGRRRGLVMATPLGFDEALCLPGASSRSEEAASLAPATRLAELAAAHGGTVVMFVSTTGDGEMPKNMARFWRALLRRATPAAALAPVRFALYGLGDRAYGPKFCAAARKLDARLQQLGAKHLVGTGTAAVLGPAVALADEQDGAGGVLAAFGPWLVDLWLRLLPPGTEAVSNGDAPELDPETVIVTAVPAEGDMAVQTNRSHCAYASGFELLGLAGPPLWMQVVTNERMTSADWTQDVRQVAFTIDSKSNITRGNGSGGDGASRVSDDLTWDAGDVAWVLPENSPMAVEALLNLYGLHSEDLLNVATVNLDVVGALEREEAAAPLCIEGRVSADELFGRVLGIEV
jgi:sulfite reductase alpha subunit-like flavoprotein